MASFEQGPIRPPSEARSLLIRVTRNCPWNRCLFCHTYKGNKFELRDVEDVKADIQVVRDICDEIKSLSWRLGFGGDIDDRCINHIFKNTSNFSDAFRSAAAWLYHGAETVFLQDADSPIIRTPQLVEVLNFIKESLPWAKRITSYGRSRTLKKKSIDELRALREAGLTRIHIGFETGYGPLLEYIKKGVSPEGHIEAGTKVKQAGIELSEYVILGLGGKRWWGEHAVSSAMALNEINPYFIRVRTLFVVPGTPLHEKLTNKDFEILSEEDVIVEERLLIESLNGITSTFKSDHMLNLLEEVEGVFPQDKERMLGVIDSFLELSDEEKMNFRVGRRLGVYRHINDIENFRLQHRVRDIISRLGGGDLKKIDESISAIMGRFI